MHWLYIHIGMCNTSDFPLFGMTINFSITISYPSIAVDKQCKQVKKKLRQRMCTTYIGTYIQFIRVATLVVLFHCKFRYFASMNLWVHQITQRMIGRVFDLDSRKHTCHTYALCVLVLQTLFFCFTFNCLIIRWKIYIPN